MNPKKRTLQILLLVLAVLAVAAILFFTNFKIVLGGVYDKDAPTIDLQEKSLTPEEYEIFCEEFPESDILWTVPFQEGRYPQDTASLTVTQLSSEDAAMLQYLPKLSTLQAQDCRDYDVLESVIRQNPQLEVLCSVTLAGTDYDQNAEEIVLHGCTQEELTALKCLTRVKRILFTNGMEADIYSQLRAYCEEKGIITEYLVAGEVLSDDTEALTLDAPGNEDVAVAALMTNLKTLDVKEPSADAVNVLSLENWLPNTQVNWEKTVMGITFDGRVTQIDLIDVLSRPAGNKENPYYRAASRYQLGTRDTLPSAVTVLYEGLVDRQSETKDLIAQLEADMAYFPNAEELIMVGCYLDNEAMAAFREAHRADYKVVWSVRCGNIAPRTDAKYFMPAKYNVYSFVAEDGINLKYCEELESIDIGHMNITDISFVRSMPNLKYMVLGETTIEDISPLSSCKNLKFLEIQRSRVRDLTPLLECSSLEDLNIGTLWHIDLSVVKKMTWLKNLWMATFKDHLEEMEAALPNTTIKAPVDTTVINNGWRELPNYYAARDLLLMYYME